MVLATKGTVAVPQFLLDDAQIACDEMRTQHSQKPPIIKDILGKLLGTEDNRIELFARYDNPRDKWDHWGLEVPGFFVSWRQQQYQ